MEIAKSLQQIQSSYIREILEAASDESVISLAGGLPDPDTFPIDLMQPTLQKLASMPDIFQYGNTQGYAPLIKHLTKSYQLPSNQQMMVCTGSQQGIDLIARAFINPGDNIVMEAPSYLGAMQVFGLSQANILTVSQDEHGPDTEALEQLFLQSNVKLFYAVPDFHNPTGVCWSLEKRKKVAHLCIQYNVALVEDAPYRELRFSGSELPMVSSFCPDNSIVLRSFSKIASPGMRIGIVSGKSAYIEPLIKVKQGADLHSSVPMQALLLGLLQEEKFPKHLEAINTLYQSRYLTLLEELKKQLPENCNVNPVAGGMFLWVSLPPCNTFDIAKAALARGVAVVPSQVFYPSEIEGESALRLNFTNSTPKDLAIAVNALSLVIKAI